MSAPVMHSNRRSLRVPGARVIFALLLAVTTLAPGGAASAQGAPAEVPSATTHGAGASGPSFNDGTVKWWYTCLPDSTSFKVTSAAIKMWSRGARIKGFQFKYRLVPSGTDGQLQLPYNWSSNASVSFKQGSKIGKWLQAGALGQSFDSAASWDIEVKLKYPRSLRAAYRYKYRLTIQYPPQCGTYGGG